jgi:hypothetical protein
MELQRLNLRQKNYLTEVMVVSLATNKALNTVLGSALALLYCVFLVGRAIVDYYRGISPIQYETEVGATKKDRGMAIFGYILLVGLMVLHIYILAYKFRGSVPLY